MSSAACIFCKIIKGDIPSFKIFESDKVFAFLDIQPLSRGHALVIPKFHGAKLTDIPDEDLLEILPVAKKIALASGATDFNILQNNGSIAHQVVEHVHFHMVNFHQRPFATISRMPLLPHTRVYILTIVLQIPKPNEQEGLGISWPAKESDMDKLKALLEEIKSKI
ncbi:Putative Remark: Hnt1 from S. cerevisiae interacts with the cyclin dependent kinase Kin28 [Penicillium brasilianum]|uniref:Putative Remark: Hnt1 from S. cerevisiae interacts with the cyclin dependent kinase Kin28 n=1 Tax=Penicillium brasilianum TaxID=104259 RepID=A0A0F7VD25_PENBI|nr:Putative Remark: Hnt1 from S. cerevisiae interacts with the cyclin dependent kinase Kin28 [Penicillium brasilianum]